MKWTDPLTKEEIPTKELSWSMGLLDEMLHAGNFDTISDDIEEVLPALTILGGLAILRWSFAGRVEIRAWNALRDSTARKILDDGRDPLWLLKGLYDS